MRVLVTGGASGLGAALAAAFLDRGDEVLIGDINEPDVQVVEQRAKQAAEPANLTASGSDVTTTPGPHTSSSSTSAPTTTGLRRTRG